jgi:hypothetical protein
MRDKKVKGTMRRKEKESGTISELYLTTASCL